MHQQHRTVPHILFLPPRIQGRKYTGDDWKGKQRVDQDEGKHRVDQYKMKLTVKTERITKNYCENVEYQ